jgi:hypothetical protein
LVTDRVLYSTKLQCKVIFFITIDFLRSTELDKLLNLVINGLLTVTFSSRLPSFVIVAPNTFEVSIRVTGYSNTIWENNLQETGKWDILWLNKVNSINYPLFVSLKGISLKPLT